MYLWHWPLIAFAHYMHRTPGRPVDAVLLLAASFGLAELTYRFVETPIRTRAWLASSASLLRAAGIGAFVLAAFAVQSYVSDGAAYRYSPVAREFLTAPFHARSQRCGLAFRILHPRAHVCALHTEPAAERRVLLWGNSHADMWSALFDDLARSHHAAFYLNARNCRATPDMDFCGPGVQSALLQFIAAQHVTDVVLASSWYRAYDDVSDEMFERMLDDVVGRVSALGVRTWLVADIPAGKDLDPLVAFEKNPSSPAFGSIPFAAYRASNQKEKALFASIAGHHDRVFVIDPSPAFCSEAACVAGKGDTVWFRDTNHFTDSGARAAAAQFEPVFVK
jgi:hypothetical protein